MQVEDELGVKLHDRATRGLTLSEDERTQLQAWYDEKDLEETAMLRASRKRNDHQESKADDRLNETLALISSLSKKIRETEAENELLRQEIAALRRRLAEKSQPMAA